MTILRVNLEYLVPTGTYSSACTTTIPMRISKTGFCYQPNVPRVPKLWREHKELTVISGMASS